MIDFILYFKDVFYYHAFVDQLVCELLVLVLIILSPAHDRGVKKFKFCKGLVFLNYYFFELLVLLFEIIEVFEDRVQ